MCNLSGEWGVVCSDTGVTIVRVCRKRVMTKFVCLLSCLFHFNLRADWHFCPLLRKFAAVPKILFPMIWIETRATITPELATSLRINVLLPTASLICSVGLLLTGLLTLGLTFLPQTVRALSENNRRNRWLHAEILDASNVLCKQQQQQQQLSLQIIVYYYCYYYKGPYRNGVHIREYGQGRARLANSVQRRV